MKNILKIFLVFSLLLSSATFAIAEDKTTTSPGTVFDGPGMEGGLKILFEKLKPTGIPTEASLFEIVLFWVKVFLMLAGILAFVAFVWAGFLYITTFAREENAETAKKIMIYAIIGILVIIFSYAIVNYFMTLGTS